MIMSTHSVTVETVTLATASNVVTGRTFGTPSAMSGAIMPGVARAIYEQFNIEIDAPYEFYTQDSTAVAKLTVGSRVNYDSEKYYVMAVQPFKGFGGSANHTRVILEKEKQSK